MTAHIPREQISAWVDHQAEPEAAENIRRHLDSCPSCRKIQEEMAEVTGWFRGLHVLDPPEYVWNRISLSLDESLPAPGGSYARLASVIHRPGWLRAELWALAATLAVGFCLAVLHWSAVRTERQQLAAIDRAYHTLLPQNAESYNPFATSPWINADMNPFTLTELTPSSNPSRTPAVKR